MRITLCLGAATCLASAARAQDPAPMHLYPAGEIQWTEGPASLPKGTMITVLEGDPTQAGVFTIRIKFPANFQVPPHMHTQTERATVISGVLHLGMGDHFDRKATRPMPAGSFGYWPAGIKHFAWMEGETVLQLYGQGPWTVTYVNPADDPRKPKP